MRVIFWFFITCIIGTIGLFAALSMKSPWVGYAVAFGAFFIFLWDTTKPKRRS